VAGEAEAVAEEAATEGVEVLGVESSAGGSDGDGAANAAARTAPLAGVLPNTGAGRLGLAGLAGAVLIAGGVFLLRRRAGAEG
jgi:LPXTG-motif cell wall-anchored protein